jgi:alpha-galactosidase
MASAIVTDIGGPLGHSSIVAREFGIPAVMGTGVATRLLLTGQMWRVSGDVFDSWINIWIAAWKTYGIGVDVSLEYAANLADFGDPGGWNDLDMLVVGLKGKGLIHGGGMSFLEYQTHMSMWCMACSPLMIGCDVSKMEKDTAALLTNREVLAINQDPLGKPAHRVKQFGPCEVWKKPLADDTLAGALINRGSSGNDILLKAGDIGLCMPGIRIVWEIFG